MQKAKKKKGYLRWFYFDFLIFVLCLFWFPIPFVVKTKQCAYYKYSYHKIYIHDKYKQCWEDCITVIFWEFFCLSCVSRMRRWKRQIFCIFCSTKFLENVTDDLRCLITFTINGGWQLAFPLHAYGSAETTHV
jgi:hypothetical protein